MTCKHAHVACARCRPKPVLGRPPKPAPPASEQPVGPAEPEPKPLRPARLVERTRWSRVHDLGPDGAVVASRWELAPITVSAVVEGRLMPVEQALRRLTALHGRKDEARAVLRALPRVEL